MTTTDEQYADIREMYMVHTVFRWEFALLPALVRGVTAGDEERSQIIADHIGLLNSVLHHHHHGEAIGPMPSINAWPYPAQE
ncbi:hypothetical protein AB0M44_48230 [Streptosporangium subroseum]|uniref:hypothetical protein n=1 Tax=Streptosporangium subroseum TaxID=106412 RepID=UPI003449170E